jgi:hypothetical protein
MIHGAYKAFEGRGLFAQDTTSRMHFHGIVMFAITAIDVA